MNTQVDQAAPKSKASLPRLRPTQEQVMSYENEGVISALMTRESLTREEAVQLFKDTLIFLYVCACTPGDHAPTAKIDVGWHHFILHTRDYGRFCIENFGAMIHHNPGVTRSEALPQLMNTYNMAEREFGRLSENWEIVTNVCNGGICDTKVCGGVVQA